MDVSTTLSKWKFAVFCFLTILLLVFLITCPPLQTRLLCRLFSTSSGSLSPFIMAFLFLLWSTWTLFQIVLNSRYFNGPRVVLHCCSHCQVNSLVFWLSDKNSPRSEWLTWITSHKMVLEAYITPLNGFASCLDSPQARSKESLG